MSGRNITISLGLILFILLFIISIYILYSVGNISNKIIPERKPIVKEGILFFRKSSTSKASKSSSGYTQKPTDYSLQINKNLSAVEATIGIINNKITEFNRNIRNGNRVQQTAINTGISIEDLNLNLDIDPVEQIHTTLTNYIQINDTNKIHYTNMVNTLVPQVSNIQRMPPKSYITYVRSGEVFAKSVRYIDELNKLTPSNTSPKIIFETEILNIMSTNFGLENVDVITEISDNRNTIEVSPSTVEFAAEIVENNITEFEKNGFVIDRKIYDKMNDEMNKFIKESVGSGALSESIFIEKCINPLKKNNITTIANLQSTIGTLSKYGYNSTKSIFLYMQKFNALNIILNTPEYNTILNNYDTYGQITDLEKFLNKCAELKIIENEDGSQSEFSYTYFMIKHTDWGITTNAQLIQYANKVSGFYTALNKEKYLRFLDTVNSFHWTNNTKNVNTPNNKLDECIKTLQGAGINTYEDYISIFKYDKDKSTLIQSGDITLPLNTVDVYTFIDLFTTYYNKYRYPSIPKQPPTTDSTTEPPPDNPTIFAKKYPAIDQNTIPNISFIQSIGVFLSTFKELQFTNTGCFGYFIKSLISGPKYMINLLDRSTLESKTPILYKYYVVQGGQGVQGFTTLTTNTNSRNNSVGGLFQRMMEPFTQLFNYTFSNTYIETLDTKSSTDGYLDSIRRMGVSDTNKIPISPTKIVNDNDFFAILSDAINNGSGSGQPLTMNLAVQLLIFFSSIQLPVTQIEQVLVYIKQFGVTPSSMPDFINIISRCRLGSPDNFTMFLNTLVKLKVNMSTLLNFITDLENFGFDRSNDPNNNMTVYLFFTLNILIKYDITYEYQYDTRYTKISNCFYNLALDGIKLPIFGNESNNLAIELLTKLNRNVDLYRSTSGAQSDKTQLNKNMRDLIIRRSDFFYNTSDTTAFGNSNSFVPTPTPETLPSFPLRLYDALFERSSLPTFMIEIDPANPSKEEPLFNGKPIQVPAKNTIVSGGTGDSPETILLQQKKIRKQILFYRHIVAQIPYENNTIPLPFDYCTISNILTTNEYDQMLRTDGSVLVIRSVMSRLLNKLLLLQRELKQTIESNNTGAISIYNSSVDTVNMISIFPHYSFYLIANYIRVHNPRENDPRKCGDPRHQAFNGNTIDPYIVELSKTNTSNPNEFSYTENYEGKRTTDEDDPDETSTTKHSYDFYNRTAPYMATSQYASW